MRTALPYSAAFSIVGEVGLEKEGMLDKGGRGMNEYPLHRTKRPDLSPLPPFHLSLFDSYIAVLYPLFVLALLPRNLVSFA